MIFDEAIAGARTITDHYAMADGDVEAMYDILEGMDEVKTIVELGVCNGRTSAVLAYVAKCREADYYGVDHFGLEGSADLFRLRLEALNLPYKLLVGYTTKVPWDGRLIDFLLIDAGHDWANMMGDCTRWIPFVRSGGWVAFDDWDDAENEQSAHAVKRVGEQFTMGWECRRGPGRMMARRKP